MHSDFGPGWDASQGLVFREGVDLEIEGWRQLATLSREETKNNFWVYLFEWYVLNENTHAITCHRHVRQIEVNKTGNFNHVKEVGTENMNKLNVIGNFFQTYFRKWDLHTYGTYE